MTRWRVFAALLARAHRTGPWPVLAGAAALGLLAAAIPAATGAQLDADNRDMLLRFTAASLALGVTFSLDDAAAATTVSVPTPRLVRFLAGVVPGLVVTALGWAVALVLAVLSTPEATRPQLRLGGLTLEAVAMAACACTLAVVVRIFGGPRAGIIAAPALFGALTVGAAIRPVFVSPHSPQWIAVHQVWAVCAVAFVVAFLIACRDRQGSYRNEE